MDGNRIIYTIGYSSFGLEEFAGILDKYGITAPADVRSLPYSAFHPDYNQETLRNFLKSRGIEYVYLGRELGARFEDSSVYTNNRVNFEKVAVHPLFRQGLKRVEEGARSFTIALMCAEKEPLACHRTILVSRNLATDFDVRHILGDETIEEHSATEERLLKLFKLDQFNLPGVTGEHLSLNEAYRLQAEKSPTDWKKGKRQKRTAMSENTLYTIGFTKKTAEEFFTLLQQAKVRRLIDVRLNNESQLAAFTKKPIYDTSLIPSLVANTNIVPDWAPTKDILDGYKKKKMNWDTYCSRFNALLEKRQIEQSVSPEHLADAVLLCSEPTADRCHRRLVAEYLREKLGGIRIFHL